MPFVPAQKRPNSRDVTDRTKNSTLKDLMRELAALEEPKIREADVERSARINEKGGPESRPVQNHPRWN